MEKMIEILGAILTGDVNTTLVLSNELMDQGKEPQSYISELLKLLETIYLKEDGSLTTDMNEKNIVKEIIPNKVNEEDGRWIVRYIFKRRTKSFKKIYEFR